jgi:teichuronic acid biosynthesis glycosyltransferase TuaC
MKTLWITNLWPDEVKPGQGSFIYSQAQSLIAAGVALDLLYIPGYRSNVEYARAIASLHQRLRRSSYDVVHAHYGYSGVVAETQRRHPVVISYLGADLLGKPYAEGKRTPSSLLVATAFAQAARLADATITKSREMESRLPERCRAHNHIIPNGVDLDFFSPMGQDAALAQLGWDRRMWNILFVGKPDLPRKNLAFAEEVVAELARRGHRVRLQVAYGLPPEQMPVMMSAATCLLFPSLSEGSPNTVKEAMAMTLPVVSTRVGDTEERLTGLRGCHLIDLEVSQAADAVEDAAAAGRIPEARDAVSELAIGSVASRVIDVYREAIARRGQRRGLRRRSDYRPAR